MRPKNLYLLTLTIALFNIPGTNFSNNNDSKSHCTNYNCTIDEIGGVNGVYIGDTKREIFRRFYKAHVNRKWYWDHFIIIGYWEHSIHFPNEDLTFFLHKDDENYKITNVEMGPNCKCKTLDNIGIGSKLADLRKIYGNIKVHTTTGIYKKNKFCHTFVTTFNTQHRIRFYCTTSCDTSSFVVNKIIIL